MSIRIVPLENHHIGDAVRLSTVVGWPHREQDLRLLMTLGEGYGLVEGQTLIGTVLHWSFSAHLATLGSVLVSPDYQRMGLGRRLVKAAIASVSVPHIELYSTVEGIDLYHDLGFTATGWVHQCQGIARRSDALQQEAHATLCQVIRPVQSTDIKALSTLDAQAVGSPRHGLLGALLELGDALVVEEVGGQLSGFALCREFGHGHVIGPVIALSPLVAKILIHTWLEHKADHFVRLDTPDPALATWLVGRGLEEVGRVQRMEAGDTLSINGSAYRYALASHALG